MSVLCGSYVGLELIFFLDKGSQKVGSQITTHALQKEALSALIKNVTECPHTCTHTHTHTHTQDQEWQGIIHREPGWLRQSICSRSCSEPWGRSPASWGWTPLSWLAFPRFLATLDMFTGNRRCRLCTVRCRSTITTFLVLDLHVLSKPVCWDRYVRVKHLWWVKYTVFTELENTLSQTGESHCFDKTL